MKTIDDTAENSQVSMDEEQVFVGFHNDWGCDCLLDVNMHSNPPIYYHL